MQSADSSFLPVPGLAFSVEVDPPDDLPFDETRADALVTVTATADGRPAPAAQAAEVLIMDRSLSMLSGGRLDEARRAMQAAVDTLPDGTLLGVVAGHHGAETVFPASGGLAPVDATARAEAKRLIGNQLAEGGTAIGTWLTRAAELFATAPQSIVRHALLFTDGRNEDETPQQLDAALRACAGQFVCDVRGLGEDWAYAELLHIADALHGTARAVLDVAELQQDFTGLLQQARRLVVPQVCLGVWLSTRFRLVSVRRTWPTEAELTPRQEPGRAPGAPDEVHVPLGAWASGTRQYWMALRFDPGRVPVGETLRAAAVTLRVRQADGVLQPCAGPVPLVVRRRSTPAFSATVRPELTRVESEWQLGVAMRACADAWERGDWTEADARLRTAVELAHGLGDRARLRLLGKVTEPGESGGPGESGESAGGGAGGDAGGGGRGPGGRGPLRLRRGVSRGEMQRLGLESTRTGAVADGGAAGAYGAAGGDGGVPGHGIPGAAERASAPENRAVREAPEAPEGSGVQETPGAPS